MAVTSFQWVNVVQEEGGEILEIQVESNGTILLENIQNIVPGITTLKYRNPVNYVSRVLKCVNGVIDPPGDDGWEDICYCCVWPKVDEPELKRQKVDSLAPYDPKNLDTRELVVLGLRFGVEKEIVKEYFKTFGRLDYVKVRSKPHRADDNKAVCFVKMCDREGEQRILTETRHFINGEKCMVRVTDSDGVEGEFRKAYVGNLGDEVDREELRAHFNQFGEVQDVLMPVPFRGFAFVTFKDEAVVRSLFGVDLKFKGRALEIKEPDTESKSKRKIYVKFSGGNTLTRSEVWRHFAKYGDVTDVYLPKNVYGLITFADVRSAKMLNKQVHSVNGIEARIQYALSKEDLKARKEQGKPNPGVKHSGFQTYGQPTPGTSGLSDYSSTASVSGHSAYDYSTAMAAYWANSNNTAAAAQSWAAYASTDWSAAPGSSSANKHNL